MFKVLAWVVYILLVKISFLWEKKLTFRQKHKFSLLHFFFSKYIEKLFELDVDQSPCT